MQRRSFLQAAAAGATLAGLGAWSDLLRTAFAATGEDYRAVVCLFMFGGNDANNMVIPIASDEFAGYTRDRSNLALPRAALLPITLSNTAGRPFALHPAMGALQGLVNAGKAAVVANVGTLAAPLTRAEWIAGGAAVPDNLFSHSDQQSQWQSGVAAASTRTGWAGRIADLVAASNGVNAGYTSVSVAGNTLWGTGTASVPYKVSPSGNFGFDFYDPAGADPLSAAIKATLSKPRGHALEQGWLDVVGRSIDNQRVLTAALGSSTLATPFPDNGLAGELKMVARLISARAALGLKRQAFFCSIGGFDTHGEDQLNDQNRLLGEVSDAVAAFHAATVELGIADKVTLYTASDFNRTYLSNGKGSDHAWGSHHFVVGGAVDGGKLYGKFPTLAVGGPDDADRGHWIPTTSVEQMAATLARWFGVAEGDLPTLFPNLPRFASSDLGFMKA
ncbi:DUF1501 domain-containing protein [Niveibacterium umoris]|uniref:Uncharacterized protein (DUF1501 family) n=1 Tax=Niveibacterium umoris TaxID=1193620 RepID=A0A840BTW4_9RHOO|nr:DUF1501 domain-containing protein [Niveibacterium umoris]MBB4013797.1 uncharacterized protein (DUF1501 family) [Niveibacterium umoris]